MNFLGELRPSTLEGWVLFTKIKLWTVGNAVDVIQGLADIELDLLEFLICVDEEIRAAVRKSLCGSAFPTTAALWSSSICRPLFERFLAYFDRLPSDLNLVDRTVKETCRQVVPFMSVLLVLDQIQFMTIGRGEEGFATKKNQKKRKTNIAMRAHQNATTADLRLFTAVDLEYPTTSQELQEVETEVLERLQGLLEVLLSAFENPKLGIYSKTLVFDRPLQQTNKPSNHSASVDPVAEELNTTPVSKSGASSDIQLLTATKYFDGSALGTWNIVISSRAASDLRQIRKGDTHVFAMVGKKIMELSQGFFSDSNQKCLVGLGTEVPIYEARVSHNLRIVYQIDLDTDVDTKLDKQIIRIYGVYAHAQLDNNRVWCLISHYHIGRRGKEYRRRCLHRETPRGLGQNVTSPAYFSHRNVGTPEDPASPAVSDGNDMPDRDLLSFIALEKFIPMTQLLIDAILNDSDVNDVFQSFSFLSYDEEALPSTKEEIVYHDSACFVLGGSGTGKTESILFKMIRIEKLFEQMEEVAKPRQVYVTQSRVLAQRAQEHYQSLVAGSPDTSNGAAESLEGVLADLADEDASGFGLPPRYSMLADRHFPLFLAFDQLCSLLEADLDLTTTAKHGAVTFDMFVTVYWPHFDYQLTKGLDPALVYSEFLEIIEGSEAALSSKCGALSRDEYTSPSHKRSSFTSERRRVYDLYEAYCKCKRQLGGYDAADRTHALITKTAKRIPGPKLDYLYIDNADDNLFIDMKLLHNLSNNPHGIFIAGDTVQSSFRFGDLKAFLWRLEEQNKAALSGKQKAIRPTLFHLGIKYRSHGGIINCTSSIIQLISELFPYSIDKLKKEIGITNGPKPIFFSGWEQGAMPFERFLKGEAEKKFDFGASQAILVRNEAARNNLRAQLGNTCFIFTLYESKGLEFDDVLLYNFFEDSAPGESAWRVIIQGLHATNTGPAPLFHEIQDAIICAELKYLYVALTRARNHCWIWDMSNKAEPMKMFWCKQALIKECGPNDPMPQLSAPGCSQMAG